jgi:hypothetical protein
VQRKNLFQDSNFPKSYLPQIRGSSWHNNEIKMIRSGYLPRVLFFNAFELGAESVNQVLSNEVLRSIAEVFSTRHCIASK